MKIFAFYNNKGGVGKSTSTINVAYTLNELGINSLVIDCDEQQNTSRFFTDEISDGGIECVLLSGDSAGNKKDIVIKNTRYEKIDVVTSGKNGSAAKFDKLDNKSQTAGAKNLSAFLKKQKKYEYIILDLPPALNSMTQAIISVCDYVFIPIELSAFAIQGVTNVTDAIVKTGTGASGAPAGFRSPAFGGCFVTKYDKKNSADKQLLDMLRSTLGSKAMANVIPLSRTIKNSINYKLAAAEYMGWTTAGRSYGKLTAEIIENM